MISHDEMMTMTLEDARTWEDARWLMAACDRMVRYDNRKTREEMMTRDGTAVRGDLVIYEDPAGIRY